MITKINDEDETIMTITITEFSSNDYNEKITITNFCDYNKRLWRNDSIGTQGLIKHIIFIPKLLFIFSSYCTNSKLKRCFTKPVQCFSLQTDFKPTFFLNWIGLEKKFNCFRLIVLNGRSRIASAWTWIIHHLIYHLTCHLPSTPITTNEQIDHFFISHTRAHTHICTHSLTLSYFLTLSLSHNPSLSLSLSLTNTRLHTRQKGNSA